MTFPSLYGQGEREVVEARRKIPTLLATLIAQAAVGLVASRYSVGITTWVFAPSVALQGAASSVIRHPSLVTGP